MEWICLCRCTRTRGTGWVGCWATCTNRWRITFKTCSDRRIVTTGIRQGFSHSSSRGGWWKVLQWFEVEKEGGGGYNLCLILHYINGHYIPCWDCFIKEGEEKDDLGECFVICVKLLWLKWVGGNSCSYFALVICVRMIKDIWLYIGIWCKCA